MPNMVQVNADNTRMRRMVRLAAMLLVAFLLGFLPPFVRTMQLKRDLAETRSRIELAEARELAALSYLEASRNNFGIASHHASRLFDRVGELAAQPNHPLEATAGRIASKRDTVMGMLATADPGARIELQEVVSLLLSSDLAESTARARNP